MGFWCRKLSFALIGVVFVVSMAGSEDWPMWRYDANRSAASLQELPQHMSLLWRRAYPKLEPTWKNPLNRDLMQFDRMYEPIVIGRTLFVASNASDRVVALETETGEERWSYHVDGPIRFPLVAEGEKLYFVSDDGCLYCLDANAGELVWKYKAVPEDRLILGNERLISTWPARGGPVIEDGTLYFASGIWPFMGVFIFALDAETGEEIWVNDSTSAQYIDQPHNSPSFASIAPQGMLVVSGDKLLVPGGRSVPACFDRHTGEMLYYHLAANNKTGGAFVCSIGDHFINYHRDQVTSLYDLETGSSLIRAFGKMPVVTMDRFYCLGESVTAMNYKDLRKQTREKLVKDEDTGELRLREEAEWVFETLWEIEVDAQGDLIKAGQRLFAGGDGVVHAIDIPEEGEEPVISWEAEVDGMASRLIAADDKLFVVTLDGYIYAFGEKKEDARYHEYNPQPRRLEGEIVEEAKSLVDTADMEQGYCLVYGVEDGHLAQALAQHTNMRVIAVSPDAEQVDQLRREFTRAGLYGKKLSVYEGDALTFPVPPYLARLIVFEDMNGLPMETDPHFFETLYQTLRPYGGTICMSIDEDELLETFKTIQQCDLPNAKMYEKNGFLLLVREGALSGAADWTHQYGDISNTVKSDDQRVKMPLGILWFGGSSNTDVLPRHAHGPPEQVVNGRLFIEGMESLSARDVYTGQVLWKRKIPGLDTFMVYYDHTYKDTPLDPAYNQVHIPGANARGTNYVVTEDKIYFVVENRCLVLDPVTGATLDEIELPERFHNGEPRSWGYIGVYEDYLIAGSDFVSYLEYLGENPHRLAKEKPFYNFDITSSRSLVVMDRHSGEVKWTFDSNLGMRHNTIIAGDGKLFCIDAMPQLVMDALKRRGQKFHATPRLLAFNIETGEIVWSEAENIFGTWLGYSKEHDTLIQAGRKSRDMLVDEPTKGMIAYQAATGEVLWENLDDSYLGPCILHGDMIITDPRAFNIKTGQLYTYTNPLTGLPMTWEYNRNYGCNYSIASEHLMTFRSAAAGFYDLENGGGTGNFGGFKSGCTSNLIAANGVLNAPDYTRTCSCSYQNQTSLAMVHDPDVEMWTFNTFDIQNEPIHRIGINLGAPGDRKSENDTLWLEYPTVGGPSPDIPLRITPEEPSKFLHHSSRVTGNELDWVAASGMKGIEKLTLRLKGESPSSGRYTIRLVFMEPEALEPGERVMDVYLQGEKVLEDFDIMEETGAVRHGIEKTFSDIFIENELTIELVSAGNDPETILCGVELIENTSLTQAR